MRVVSVTAKPFGKIVDQTLELGSGLTVVYGRNGTGKSTWHAALYAGLYGRLIGPDATDVDEVIGSYRLPNRPGLGVAIELELDTGVRMTVDRDLTGVRPDMVALAAEVETVPYRIRDGQVDLSDLIGLDRRSFAVSSWLRQRRTPDEVVDSPAPGLGLANPDLALAVGVLLGTREAEQAIRRLARARAELAPTLHRCRAIVDERAGQLFAARQHRDRVHAARREVADRQRELAWAEQEYRLARAAAERQAREAQRRELEELRTRLAMYGYAYGSLPTSRDTAMHPSVIEAWRELDEALAAGSAPPQAAVADPHQNAETYPEPYEQTVPEPYRKVSAPVGEPSELVDTTRSGGTCEPVGTVEPVGPSEAGDPRPPSTPAPPSIPAPPPSIPAPPPGRPGATAWRPRVLRAGIVAAFGLAVSIVLWTAGLDVVALLWMAMATVATTTAAGLLPVLGPVRTPPVTEPEPSTVDDLVPGAATAPSEPPAPVAAEPPAPDAVPAGRTAGEDASTAAGPTGPERISQAQARLAAALTERGVPARPDNVDAQFALYQRRCELAAQIAAKEAELAAGPTDPTDPASPASSADPAGRADSGGVGLNQPGVAKPVLLGQVEQLHAAWQAALDAHDDARRSLDAVAHGFDEGAVGRAEAALRQAQERHERHQRLDRALERAGDLLRMAAEQASGRLRAKVEEALQVLLADVAEERGLRVTIDPNMRVQLNSDGLRSEGLLDQATVLTRVALSRHLARGETVGPLLLDDITSRIDEERAQHLLVALRQLARTRQVVLFAHDPTTRDWAVRAAEHDSSIRLLQTVAVDQPVRPWPVAAARAAA